MGRTLRSSGVFTGMEATRPTDSDRAVNLGSTEAELTALVMAVHPDIPRDGLPRARCPGREHRRNYSRGVRVHLGADCGWHRPRPTRRVEPSREPKATGAPCPAFLF